MLTNYFNLTPEQHYILVNGWINDERAEETAKAADVPVSVVLLYWYSKQIQAESRG